MDEKQLLDRIKSIIDDEDRSSVGIGSVEFIKSGWSNVVVCIDQNFIFRFNRFKSPQFEVEKAFLNHFAPISSTSIPAPQHWGDDFIGYPRLEGERFAPEKFWQLSDQAQDQIIQQLGRFLSQLHGTKFEHPNLKRYPYGGDDFWQELWPLVAPKLHPSSKQKAKSFFEMSYEALEGIKLPQVIVHSDLGTNNLLVDFESAELTGIIDFSDIALGDPAEDFDGFYRHFGKSFVHRLLKYYDHPTGDHFWLRVKQRALRKQFFIVYFAEKYRYQDAIPSIIKNIERLIEEIIA